MHVPGETLIENKYKSYALADDKVFNGSVSHKQNAVICYMFALYMQKFA